MQERVFSSQNDKPVSAGCYLFSKKGPFRAFFLCAFLFCLHSAIYADLIKLINGNSVRGTIVSESDTSVIVQLPFGNMTIPRSRIREIVREKAATVRRKQAERLRALGSYKRSVRFYEQSLAAGGEPEENARIIEGVLSGTDRGGARSAVLLNAGAAIRVAGRAESLADGVQKAAQSVDEGAAAEALEQLREATRRR